MYLKVLQPWTSIFSSSLFLSPIIGKHLIYADGCCWLPLRPIPQNKTSNDQIIIPICEIGTTFCCCSLGMDEAEAADAETEGRSNADTHFGNGGNNMILLFLWEIRKSFDLETAKA